MGAKMRGIWWAEELRKVEILWLARQGWQALLAPFDCAQGRQDDGAGRRITYGIGRPPHRRGYAGSTMAEWYGEASGMQSGANRRTPKRPAAQAAQAKSAAALAWRERLGRVMVPPCARSYS